MFNFRFSRSAVVSVVRKNSKPIKEEDAKKISNDVGRPVVPKDGKTDKKPKPDNHASPMPESNTRVDMNEEKVIKIIFKLFRTMIEHGVFISSA